MAKWNEYGLKTGTSARDEVLILDSDTNTNKRITVGDIQEFANGKMLEKENSTLNTEEKTLIGAINEVDANNDTQDKKIEEVENKLSGYVKKTDVDSTLSVPGSPADAKVVGDALEKDKKAIEELADKKITKFYASSQGNTHLPDSDKGKIQDMFLYGKSEQVQYKGYNKLTLRDKQQINTGIECKPIDSKLQFKGTATSTYCTFDAKEVVISAGKKITAYTDSKHDFFIWFRDSDNKLYVLNKNTKTATYDKNVTIKQFGLQNYQSGDSINEVVDFGLMVGSDDFEPYVGGIPSPNPDYPQEIKAVVNPKVVVRGKNLLKVTANTQTINGIIFTNNGDGTYTIDGTSTDRIDRYIGTAKTEKKKQYKLVGWDKNAPYQKNVCGMYVVEKTNEFDDGGNGIIYDSTKDEVYVRIVIEKGKTFNNALIKPMVTNDLTATYEDYEPYTEQSVTLPYTLYAIPVSTGGNVTIGGQKYVADYVDVERGKLVRMCKEIDFAKTKQNMYQNILANTKEVRYLYKDLGIKELDENHSVLNGVGYINKAVFAGKTTWGIDREGVFSHGQGSGDKNLTLRIPKNVDAREYFTSIGGCKGVFQIGIPEEIELTPEQIQAYKSLSTNYPVTNVEVLSEQLDGYTIFNYPISMADGWNYVKQQLNDNRDYIYDMDLQSAEAYVNSEYAVALTELEVM